MVKHEHLLKKYGSEEAIKAHYRELQKLSRVNYSGTGGLASPKLSEEEKFRIRSMGGKTNKGKKRGKKDRES